VWNYECDAIRATKIPNFALAKELPAIGTPLVILSQWSKPTPKPHIGAGRVTSFTDKRDGSPSLVMHSCPTDYGNCFSPIVLNNNPNKVIGIHTGGDVF
jgi:hypothetical protein